MGTRSVLDFACCLEYAIRQRTLEDGDQEQTTHSLRLLADVTNEPWVDVISEEDPRFASLFPLSSRGTLLQRIDAMTRLEVQLGLPVEGAVVDQVVPQPLLALAGSIRGIYSRVQEIKAMPLEVALTDYVRALVRRRPKAGPVPRQEQTRVEVICARLGILGSPAVTLEEAGKMIGVTRERIRQMQLSTTSHLPSNPYMPALDKALEVISSKCPLGEQEFTQVLRDAGVTAVDFHPSSLLAAAELCGRDPNFAIEHVGSRAWVVAGPTPMRATQVVVIARKQASAYGASNIAEVRARAEEEGLTLDLGSVHELIAQYSPAEFLTDDWFWYPDGKRNRLFNQARKMLSVYASLQLPVLREGLRRAYRWRRLGVVPPRAVLRVFFEHHPMFVVDAEERVRYVELLDYRTELAEVERAFVDILRQSPTGLLDRESFESECDRRGINHNTFTAYSTYSPILEHVTTDVWALRGSRIDPAAVEAVRLASSHRPKETRLTDHGWSVEGRLWLMVRLARHPESTPIHIPAAIHGYVGEGRYAASTEDGKPAGVVVINADGACWGHGPFLARRGADEDDTLVVEFDLVERRVMLRLDASEVLAVAD
jgi:hypothetical protein